MKSHRYVKSVEKETLEQFKHVVKICLNKGHIFQKTLRNTWTAILKVLGFLRL